MDKEHIKNLRKTISKNIFIKDQIKSVIKNDIESYKRLLEYSDENLLKEVERNPKIFRTLLTYLYNDVILEEMEVELEDNK